MINEYFDALERLRVNKPIIVPKNTKITKDSVAIEAGRKKGTIKKSRAVFNELIIKIDEVAKAKSSPTSELKENITKYKVKSNEYRELYESALNRELMLIEQLNEMQKELKKYKPHLTM